MSRERRSPGTWGKISTTERKPGSWQARAYYTWALGPAERATGAGATREEAVASLVQKLTARDPYARPGYNAPATDQTTITELAKMYLEDRATDAHLRSNSFTTYRSTIVSQIIPALGAERVLGCNAGVLDRYLHELASRGLSPDMSRRVLRQMFDMAIREQIWRGPNPIDSVRTIRRERPETRALTADDIRALRQLIEEYRIVRQFRPGPAMTSLLPDLVDLLTGTGLRPGEALALRLTDLNLESQAASTVSVSGTIVTITGAGTMRQPATKTSSSEATLILPRYARAMLLRRTMALPSREAESPVFPTRNGTWHQVGNVSKMWRKVVEGTEYDWVTPRVFRASVATLIARTAGIEEAASQLRHSDSRITRNHYIERARLAPDASSFLDVFAPPAGSSEASEPIVLDADAMDA